MIIPDKLTQDDLVVIIAPARKVELNQLQSAEELLTSWGLKVERSPNLMTSDGIFAGTESQRKADLQWALDHREAKAIWCYRGGYGSIQLLEAINPAQFLQFPKWIIGFSDITFLHCFSSIILNTASIHATMPINIVENTSFSLDSLKQILLENTINYQKPTAKNDVLGTAKGEIFGGNLAVLCATLGTNYQVSFEDKILFIEDIDEYYYQIDRMLWQLKFSGVFHHIRGLIVGHFTNIKDNKIPFGKSLEEIILEKTKGFNFPISFGFPSGHENENWPLVFGKEVQLNVDENQTSLKLI
jgi:muramoyltetrapeptide carboxypeptidase